MNRRLWLWSGSALVVIVALPLLMKNGLERELASELALARREGMPVSTVEFAQSMSPAPPSANAALIYKALPNMGGADLKGITVNVLFPRSPTTLAAGRLALSRYGKELRAFDRAVRLPRCWFNRDWSNPAGILFPEFARIKTGARLFSLRGSIAAAEGRPADALAEIPRIGVLARHAGEERTGIGLTARQSILEIGIDDLVWWCYSHPDDPRYSDALRKAVDEYPSVDLRQLYGFSFLDVFSTIEMSASEEGRRKLFYTPKVEDAPGLV